jgi:hypothetical protein
MKTVYFALGAIDVLMNKCGTAFHKQVAQQAFMKQLTSMLISPNMPQEIKTRITHLIQKWALRFEQQQDTLPLFTQLYQALKKRGVEFPAVQSQAGQGGSQAKPDVKRPSNSDSKGASKTDDGAIPHKLLKLMNELNQIKGNVNIMNEVVDSTEPGNLNDTIIDMYNGFKKIVPKIQEKIASVDNETVMQACLIVNDDLVRSFQRVKDLKEGRKPADFVPGESQQKNVLNPTHIYSKQSASDAPPKQDAPK